MSQNEMRPWVLVVVALGCAPEEPAKAPAREAQSYSIAIRTFCDVDVLSGANVEDPLDLSATREEYLLAHVKNGDGIYFLTLFRVAPPERQAAMLASEAAALGFVDCELVRSLRSEAAAP